MKRGAVLEGLYDLQKMNYIVTLRIYEIKLKKYLQNKYFNLPLTKRSVKKYVTTYRSAIRKN